VIFVAFKIFPANQAEVIKRTKIFNVAVMQPVKYAIYNIRKVNFAA
jgi:hypothetical protein